MDHIGHRIKEIARRKNLNQTELANEIGVSHGMVSKVFGGGNFGIKVLTGILSAFDDISAEWLMRGIGPMIKPGSEPRLMEEPRTPYPEDLYNFHELVKKVKYLEDELKKAREK